MAGTGMVAYAVEVDGRWHVIDVSPGTMIAFEDEFGQSMPDQATGAHMWRHVAWLAHRVLAPDSDFDTWVAGLTNIASDSERIDELRTQTQTPDPTPLRAASGARE